MFCLIFSDWQYAPYSQIYRLDIQGVIRYPSISSNNRPTSAAAKKFEPHGARTRVKFQSQYLTNRKSEMLRGFGFQYALIMGYWYYVTVYFALLCYGMANFFLPLIWTDLKNIY